MINPDLKLLLWIDQNVREMIPKEDVEQTDKVLRAAVGFGEVLAAYNVAWDKLGKMTLQERWEWLANTQPEALAEIVRHDLARTVSIATPFQTIFLAAQALDADGDSSGQAGIQQRQLEQEHEREQERRQERRQDQEPEM